MKNQITLKQNTLQRTLDRKNKICFLLDRFESKHHVTTAEMKFGLGKGLWDSYRQKELAYCPAQLTPSISKQLSKYSEALRQADSLNLQARRMQKPKLVKHRRVKMPATVVQQILRTQSCQAYSTALEILRPLLEQSSLLHVYFDRPVLGDAFDDFGQEYESMPRFWDTRSQMNREILSRFRKPYLTSLYKDLYGSDYEPTEQVHFPSMYKSDSTRHCDHPLDENWSFDQNEPGPSIGFFHKISATL